MDRVAVLPNERINIDDYEDGAGARLVQLDQFREERAMALPEGRASTPGSGRNGYRILGPRTAAGVVDGFAWNPIVFGTDSSATLKRGAGVMPFFDAQNQLRFGYVFGDEGLASIVVNFATAPVSSVQDVYVRVTATQAQFGNRVFWNPSGAPAREFVDNVSTRVVSAWEVTFQTNGTAPPGNGDWVKIWQVTINGAGKISAIADYRHFYFEGDPANVTPFVNEWGGGTNDRNTDRGTYGVTDQHLWNHAVRRQLDDIIGQTGWYKAVPTDLTKMFRVVTVDQPAGVKGDYATIAAAVTALVAGNGGTILLKAGTYAITAELGITKAVNIIGVEQGVFVQNQINAAASYVFVVGSLSMPCRFERFQITNHASLSSEGAIRVNGNNTRALHLVDCVINGEINMATATVLAEGCEFQDAATNNFSMKLLVFSGGPAVAKFNRCLITGGTHTGRGDTVTVSGVSYMVSNAKSDISFSDCTFIGQHTGTTTLRTTSTTFNLRLQGCDLFVDPPDSTHPTMEFAAGNVTLRDCSVRVNASGDPWNNCLIRQTTGHTAVADQLLISGCRIDCNNVLHRMPSADQCGIQFAGRRSRMQDCEIYNVLLPDSTVQATGFHFINTNPSASGDCYMVGNLLYNWANPVANHVHQSFVGQSSGQTGTGHVWIQANHVDGSNHTFRSTVSAASVFRFSAGTAGVASCHIERNYTVNGAYAYVVFVDGAGVTFVGNQMQHTAILATPIDQIVFIQGSTSEGERGYCVAQHNQLVYGATTGTTAVMEVRSFNRADVTANIGIRVAGSEATPSDLFVSTITNLTIHGNNFDGTVGTSVSTITNQLPATLNNHNF